MIIQEVIEGPNCLTLDVTGELPRKESLPKRDVFQAVVIIRDYRNHSQVFEQLNLPEFQRTDIALNALFHCILSPHLGCAQRISADSMSGVYQAIVTDTVTLNFFYEKLGGASHFWAAAAAIYSANPKSLNMSVPT